MLRKPQNKKHYNKKPKHIITQKSDAPNNKIKKKPQEFLFISEKFCHLKNSCPDKFTKCPFTHCIYYDIPN